MVLQERPPQRAHLVARGAARERVERLAELEEQPFASGVLLFDPRASRIDTAQDGPVTAADHLADDRAARLRDRRLVFLEARDTGVDVRRRRAQRRDRLGQA